MKEVRLFAVAGIVLCVLCCLSIPCYSADVTDRASMSFSAGTLFFISDEYMNGNAFDSDRKPRFYGNMTFGYVLKPYLAATLTAGYGWQGYSYDDMMVCTVAPVTVGAEYRYGKGKYVPRAGAGFGMYYWAVLYDRKVMKDPVTREELKRGNFGGYVMGGLDYFAMPKVAISLEVTGHRVFSKDLDAFPSGFAYNDDALIITTGIKYFFGPQRK